MLGDAPVLGESAFEFINTDARIFRFSDAIGFDSESWGGWPNVIIDVEEDPARWLTENGFPPVSSEMFDSESPSRSPLIFYALGLEFGSSVSLVPSIADGTIEYPFWGDRSEVTYVAEISKDLVNWVTDGVTISEPNSEGIRIASINLNDSYCFVRFRFIQDS